MKKNLAFLILIAVFLISGACQSKEFNAEYKKKLNIAVIGEIPDIASDDIEFTKIKFKEIENNEFYYDAIFVMKNYLSEAAQDKNIKRFRNSSKPIFFIGTKASYFPFIETGNSLSYEDYVKRVNITNYEISGIIFVDDRTGYQSFNVSAFVDENSLSSSDKDKIFSEVFNTIRKNKLYKSE